MHTPGNQAITFTCCIEHGRLEGQTLLMLQTLRENGGVIGQARVIVVVARFGPPLSARTRDKLRELGAELVFKRRNNPAHWYNFSNKLVALQVAESMATTPLVAWLDSDVLVAAEPTGLILNDNEDFAARAEYLIPAIYEGSTEQVPYWNEVCALIGISIEQMPFINLDHPKLRMRLYFNAGIYVWRRGLGFPAQFLADYQKVLRSRVALHDGNVLLTDQVLLGAVACKLGMRWKHLSYVDHHMTFQGQIDGISASPPMTHSSLVHYSGSLREPHRPRFLNRLQTELPHVHLAVLGAPAPENAPLHIRALEFVCRGSRKAMLTAFEKMAKRAALG